MSKKHNIAVFNRIKSELRTYDLDSVAYAAGCHVNTLYHWLDGTTQAPRLSTIVNVCRAIGYELTLTRAQVQLKLVA